MIYLRAVGNEPPFDLWVSRLWLWIGAWVDDKPEPFSEVEGRSQWSRLRSCTMVLQTVHNCFRPHQKKLPGFVLWCFVAFEWRLFQNEHRVELDWTTAVFCKEYSRWEPGRALLRNKHHPCQLLQRSAFPPHSEAIFVDGCHLYECVDSDLKIWLPKLRPGLTWSCFVCSRMTSTSFTVTLRVEVEETNPMYD